MNTRDIVVGDAIFGLFKGEPGTGKSIAAHSFPKPTYTFDLDRKMSSVKTFYPGEDFEYDNFSDLITLNRRLEDLLVRCDYKTIIFDSLTSLSSLAMKMMIKHRNPGMSSKTVRAGVPGSEIEDYGGETNEINLVIDLLKAIHLTYRVNVIMTAHVIVVEHTAVGGKVTNVSRSLVTAGKKIAAVIPTQFDEAYHFDANASFDPAVSGTQYMVHTKHAGTDWARTALKVPNTFEWTGKSFHRLLYKHLTGDISV